MAAMNDAGTSWKASQLRSLSLGWNQIALTKVWILMFRIHAKDGNRYEPDVGGLTYEEHTKLKPKDVDLSRSTGIDVRST